VVLYIQVQGPLDHPHPQGVHDLRNYAVPRGRDRGLEVAKAVLMVIFRGMPEKKPEATSDTTETGAWGNGLTLKRTRDGYSWTISVAARSASIEDVRQAVEAAKEIDDELTSRYYGATASKRS
jgi:hypothetical protein